LNFSLWNDVIFTSGFQLGDVFWVALCSVFSQRHNFWLNDVFWVALCSVFSQKHNFWLNDVFWVALFSVFSQRHNFWLNDVFWVALCSVFSQRHNFWLNDVFSQFYKSDCGSIWHLYGLICVRHEMLKFTLYSNKNSTFVPLWQDTF